VTALYSATATIALSEARRGIGTVQADVMVQVGKSGDAGFQVGSTL